MQFYPKLGFSLWRVTNMPPKKYRTAEAFKRWHLAHGWARMANEQIIERNVPNGKR
jgi:hypothetical protein